jgi:hypothetical protein
VLTGVYCGYHRSGKRIASEKTNRKKNTMLTSSEANEARQNLTYPGHKDKAAYDKYNAQVADIEAQWKEYLVYEYGYDLPESVQKSVFSRAWEAGHSSGYTEVEYHYQEDAEFAREVIAATR